MSHTLIIIFPAASCGPDTAVSWLLSAADDHVSASGCTALNGLSLELQSLCDDYSVVALVPIEGVLSAEVEIPSTQLRQIRQALPYMIEELIADDIDNVHTAIASDYRDSLPQVQAIVVEHRQLIEWLDLLHSHQLSPDAILVDALCLPLDENSWTLVVDGERLLVRKAFNSGMAVQLNDLPLILPSLLAQAQQIQSANSVERPLLPQLHVVASSLNSNDCASAGELVDYLQREFPAFAVKSSQFKEPLSELIAEDWQMQKAHGINLLQGGYALSKRGAGHPAAWGKVAAVAAVGMVAYLLFAIASGWYFDYRASQLERQSVAMYRLLYPAERRVVNPRKQLQNHLLHQGASGGSSFLSLLTDTAQQMAGQSEAERVSVQQLRFNDEQGDLKIEVNSQSLDQLDGFKNRLAASGLKVDINSAAEEDGGVVGRIVVSPL